MRDKPLSQSATPQSTLAAKRGTTPFPNPLLDEVMPKLRDTEWRVLCVIVRQTRGWRDPHTGRRKRSDWLTHRQLLRRTGRASAAVCRAIQRLVSNRLIQVHTERGALSLSAADRRRSGARLYYRLHPGISERSGSNERSGCKRGELRDRIATRIPTWEPDCDVISR
jgi:hypothetical protein